MSDMRFVTCDRCLKNLLKIRPDGTAESLSSKSEYDPQRRRWVFSCRCGATPVALQQTIRRRLDDSSDKHIYI